MQQPFIEYNYTSVYIHTITRREKVDYDYSSDFDGIVEHVYPAIGKPIPFAIETLIRLQQEAPPHPVVGARRTAQEALDYCAERAPLLAANENYPGEDRTAAPRKLTADLFIDDRNLGGLTDWGMITTPFAMEKGIGTYLAIMSSQGYDVPRKEKRLLCPFAEKMIQILDIYTDDDRHTTTIQRRYTTYCNNDSRIMLLKIHK